MKSTLITSLIIVSRILRGPLFTGLLLLLLMCMPGIVNASPVRPTSAVVGGRHATHSSPNVPGTVLEYPIPISRSQPSDITGGPDLNLWFTEERGKIGQITPAGAITQECVLPFGHTTPLSVTSGPGNLLWFTLIGSNEIGSVTTTGCTFHYYQIPTANSQPWDITAGPDGNLWFTEFNGDQIGKLTPATGAFIEYPLGPNRGPMGITSAFGSLWFTEYRANGIGKITTAGMIVDTLLGQGIGPANITQGPKGDGNLWFTELNADKIAEIAQNLAIGSYVQYPLSPGAQPTDIAPMPFGLGCSNGLWFTEYGLSRIGHWYIPNAPIACLPHLHEYPTLTLSSQPWGITLEPGGGPKYYWFTEFRASNIGNVTFL